MKIVDHVGNSIVKGRLVRWQPSPQGGPGNYYVKVADVVPPTKDQPGKVVITVMFGIEPTGKKDTTEAVVRFADFVTVYDPEDELRAEAALKRAIDALPDPTPVPTEEVADNVQPIRQD